MHIKNEESTLWIGWMHNTQIACIQKQNNACRERSTTHQIDLFLVANDLALTQQVNKTVIIEIASANKIKNKIK